MKFVSVATDVNSLPTRIQQLGASNVRLAGSCGLAVLSVAFIALMVYLVEIHVPRETALVADYFPVTQVFLCVCAASICAVAAWFSAVPALVTRRALPLLWLVPMTCGCVWFVEWYDWNGLFEYGKAWANVGGR